LIKEGTRNSTIFEWVNKRHESQVDKYNLADVLSRFYCEPPYLGKVSIYKAETFEEAEPGEISHNTESASGISHDTDKVYKVFEGKYLYDPKVEKWYKFNSSHYEHVPEKVLRIEKNFVFFKVQRTLETNKIPSR
jgi:hypothetical protein